MRRSPSLAALAAFCLFALIDEPTPLDLAAYVVARRRYRRSFELAQRPLEWVGLPGIYIPAALLVARALRRRRRRGGRQIVNAAVAGWLALRLTRLLIHRPRPPRPRGRKPKSESTFPSGHTAGLTAVAVALAQTLENEQILTRRQARAVALGLPLAIGFNRVYVREHWVTDVLGGWALGAAVGLACAERSSRGALARGVESGERRKIHKLGTRTNTDTTRTNTDNLL